MRLTKISKIFQNVFLLLFPFSKDISNLEGWRGAVLEILSVARLLLVRLAEQLALPRELAFHLCE